MMGPASISFVVLLVAQAVLVLAVIATAVEFLIVHYSKEMQSPFLRTPPAYFNTIFDALNLRAGDVLYDLGCGDGSLLRACAVRNPSVTCIGIERNPLLCTYARFRARGVGNPKNLTFVRGNLFDADLHKATRIYTYLVPSSMAILSEKLERETKNIRVVSRAFPFKGSEARATLSLAARPGAHGQHRLHVYEF